MLREASFRNERLFFAALFVAKLGEVRKEEVNELLWGNDDGCLKGLWEVFGIAGYKEVGTGGMDAFQ